MTESNNNTDVQAAAFIERWAASGASERANFQSFLNELCDLLDVARPDPATEHPESDAYVFERPITFQHADGTSSTNYIDLYRRNCFVLEAKQAVSAPDGERALSQKHTQQRRKAGGATRGTGGWDTLMRRARNQAERYARALPAEEGRPPFLVVLDVGHAIELYSEFSRTGGNYVPFPDPASHRIALVDMALADTRDRLRLLWTDPESLDPSRHSAAVTRDIAQRLARLARSLEQDRHPPEYVAGFLMRCLFTMFAEDVGLLPRQGFQELLESLRGQPRKFAPMAETLWRTMKHGGFSGILREDLLHFNGRFFDHTDAIPLTADQLELLIEAANADWSDVEPAIFGTLLERALDPRERHKLGAHYTPRAYVERLVMPTIIEPLREEWASVEAAAEQFRDGGDEKKAIAEISAFHDRLCHVRVLDPACGSGNFLYVTLEHLKRLEGEVLEALKDFGQSGKLDLAAVSPEQFLGLEINPRAAAIAELVLWIGHLQWHFRTRGNVTPSLPVIKDFDNIECRDAVLDYDEEKVITDDAGRPVTHWDGRTTKPHPVTGKEVPDESAQAISYEYINPRPAQWPEADFVVGNPPFVGNKRMRDVLGDGYVEALRSSYPQVPNSADLVMYWWHKAALLARAKKIERFGLITTNSFTQTFNRRVAEHHMTARDPLSLVFAVPDHPWVDTTDGAAVRISMTVGSAGEQAGQLMMTLRESKEAKEDARNVVFQTISGLIHANLTAGPDVSSARSLRSNDGLACRGVIPVGMGFVLTQEELASVPEREKGIVKSYVNGRDVVQSSRGLYIIDAFGLSQAEFRERFPFLYQQVLERVKPQRDQVRRKSTRQKWWIFGEARATFRPAINGLSAFVVTPQVSKHAIFDRLTSDTLPDDKLIAIALEDFYFLGVLSSVTHKIWAGATGSLLEDRPVYDKTTCFDAYPFPTATKDQLARIRDLAEQLDRHRKRQQAAHEKLTLTGMYNVVEKLKAGEALTAKEKSINEHGLCEVLLDLHRELDAAVIEAYGWPADIGEGEILERLVALNAERAAEEARGQVRWLRPEYQAPEGEQQQVEAGLDTPAVAVQPARGKQAWPKELPLRARAVQQALRGLPGPGSSAEVSALFKGGRNREQQIAELLDTLAALGQVRAVDESRYAVN